MYQYMEYCASSTKMQVFAVLVSSRTCRYSVMTFIVTELRQTQ